jgi:hypothetical protein
MTTGGERMDNRNGPQRKCPMRCGQIVHVIPLAIGGLVTVKARSIPRSHTAFYIADGIPGEAVNVTRGGATALCGDTKK